MLETSKDLLYLVISFSILWITIFICWVIYYIAMILREVKLMVKDVKDKIALMEKVLLTLKQRLGKSSIYLKLITDTLTNVMEFVKDKRKETKKSK